MTPVPERSCRICGADSWSTVYEGPVRRGTFGDIVEATVLRCGDCSVEVLPALIDDLAAFYETEEYRRSVGEEASVEHYFRAHDDEQLDHLALLKGLSLRGATVADIGCAGGSFLDGVKGLATETVAIEPAGFYHASLRDRGHHVYAGVEEARADYEGKVDIAASFAVIEHVPEPVDFLRGIRRLLKTGGTLVISTPNRGDVLLTAAPDPYRSFWYRVAHVHYFTDRSLARAAAEAGFSASEITHHHKYGFANFLHWVREGKPTGNTQPSPLGKDFDAVWKAELERAGAADYLHARLRA